MSLFSPPATSSPFSARCCLVGSSQLSPPSMLSLLIATSLYHHPLKITHRDLLPDTTWTWALESSEHHFKRSHIPALPPLLAAHPRTVCSVGLPSTADVQVLPTTTLPWAGSKRLLKSLEIPPPHPSITGIKAQDPLNYLNLRTISPHA